MRDAGDYFVVEIKDGRYVRGYKQRTYRKKVTTVMAHQLLAACPRQKHDGPAPPAPGDVQGVQSHQLLLVAQQQQKQQRQIQRIPEQQRNAREGQPWRPGRIQQAEARGRVSDGPYKAGE